MHDDRKNEIFELTAFVIVSLCFLLLISGIVMLAYQTSRLEQDYRIKDGWEILEEKTAGAAETLYHTKLMNESGESILFCRGAYQFMSVQINGELAGFYPGARDDPAQLGYWDAAISLPQGEADVILRVSSPVSVYKGTMVRVYCSSRANIDASLASQSFLKIFLAAISIMAGAFFMVISLSGRMSYNEDLALLAFGIFTVIYAVFSLFHESGAEYLVTTMLSPRTVGFVSFAAFYLILIPNMSIFVIKSVCFKPLSRIFLAAMSVFVLVVFAAHLTGLRALPEFIQIRQILVFSYSLCYCVTTLIEFKKGNPFAIWLFVWISVTMTAYAADVFGWLDIRVSSICITLMTMIVWANSTLSYIRKMVKERAQVQGISLLNQMTLERYESAKSCMEQIRQARHELKNHLGALRIMLDKGEEKKAKAYLHEIAQEEANEGPVLYSDNFLIDGIIGGAAFKMQRSRIHFSWEISVPQQLPFSEKSLNSFLMNLLDNAIESCCRAEDGVQRQISLMIRVREPYLVIRCTNTKGNPLIRDKDAYVTSKEDKLQHGLGTQIMKQIAERCGGMLEIEEDGDWIILSAALRLDAKTA